MGHAEIFTRAKGPPDFQFLFVNQKRRQEYVNYRTKLNGFVPCWGKYVTHIPDLSRSGVYLGGQVGIRPPLVSVLPSLKLPN